MPIGTLEKSSSSEKLEDDDFDDDSISKNPDIENGGSVSPNIKFKKELTKSITKDSSKELKA